MPTYTQIVWDGAMAMLIGLLIGLERQHSQKADEPLFAGFRTFPVITLTGFLAGLVAKVGFPWVLAVALAGVCAVAVAAYFVTAQGQHKGATTELVAILAFVLGALTAFNFVIPAATFAVVITLLLSIKAPLHRFAEKIQEEEIYAILKFGIVTVIVLPLLPNRTYGPFQVLNPRLVWLMVVLISAVSMVGYVLMRLMGARHGIAVTGILGGLASSTATTFGLSQKAREAEDALARFFALGILIACTIMFFRMLILTFVVDPHLGRALVGPIMVPALVGIVVALFLWRRKPGTQSEAGLRVRNPMELWTAVKFGILFAIVLFVSRAAYQYFGSSGVYFAGALAGMTDVDAFTISAARLGQQHVLAASTANASILLAGAMNTLVKGGIAAVLGGRALRRVVLPLFGVLFLAALVSCIVVACS
jgi:uncharacterized membrane protein (DUF4010 family)